VSSLNPGQNTGYPNLGFHGFPQSFHANAGIVHKLGHGPFLPKPSLIHPSSFASTLYSLVTDSVIKTYKKKINLRSIKWGLNVHA
jgi:hypothetical protein